MPARMKRSFTYISLHGCEHIWCQCGVSTAHVRCGIECADAVHHSCLVAADYVVTPRGSVVIAVVAAAAVAVAVAAAAAAAAAAVCYCCMLPS